MRHASTCAHLLSLTQSVFSQQFIFLFYVVVFTFIPLFIVCVAAPGGLFFFSFFSIFCVRASERMCSIKRKINRKRQKNKINETISYTRRQKSLFYIAHRTIHLLLHVSFLSLTFNIRNSCTDDVCAYTCVHISRCLADVGNVMLPADPVSHSNQYTRNMCTRCIYTRWIGFVLQMWPAIVSFDLIELSDEN